ncbi:hypothetical protein psyc5s11_29830 [Clostridium gelidum]|uniref:Uncharacterized protein n=1 Tax=Clostridium gelidum TaxID=704125 RepID=A0ABM7T6M5_9CLOT|nr:hypothetical protein [Clostridium gelidum]BCZ46916.1 hypothetical protein psyc5s11_29830 [Clostridium gelidum]
MKRKLMTKIISSFLVAGTLLFMAPSSKASADIMFNMISRAAKTCSSIQMEQQKILSRGSMVTPSRPSIPTPISIPQIQQKKNLATFAIDSYIEHSTDHKQSEEIVHRSNLPITILTWMSGYGNVTGVSIDGVALDSALVGKAAYDNVDIDTRCMEFITLDDSTISALNNGKHKVVVSCTGLSGSSFVTFTDDFTFDLEN